MNLLLFRSGWVLIGLTLVLMLFQVVPLKPVDPQWQLTFISNLLGNCSIALIGSVLVCYASRREDLDSRSIRQANFLRTFAAWLALGILLLVPAQFMASTGIVRTNYVNGMASMRQLEKVISNLRDTKNEQELREQLTKFPEVPALPPKFDVPYQEVRNTIVESLSARRVASITQLAKSRDQNLQVVIKESFRNSASLVLSSFGFMTIAISNPSQRTIITSLALLLEKLRVGNLWFANTKKRKPTAINPSWIDNKRKDS